MSDRAPGQAVIYDCPEEKRALVMEVLEKFNFWLDFGIGAEEGQPLTLGVTYGEDDAALDAYEEVASALIEKVPEATFITWSDPKYEYDGMAVMYAPDLGRYTGRSNSNGETYITTREVRDAVIAGDLEKVAGLAWLDRIEALREAVDG